MREPPANLTDATLRACLRADYGIVAQRLTFLPLGHDAFAGVYRVDAEDGGTYFLKARQRIANEAGLLVPRYLSEQGVGRVVAPLPNRTGALWTAAGRYSVVLYPFICGRSGMEQGLSDRQWREYGVLLRRIHDVAVPPALARALARESFAPTGDSLLRELDAQIGTRTFADPAASALAACWQAQRDTIRLVVTRAEVLGRRLAQAAPPLVLCHADIHTGNVLADADRRVWFVDWDETLLAPRERDLMFVAGGGISRRLVGPREEALFFRGYDRGNRDTPAAVAAVAADPLALAYYRCAWAVADIAAFGDEVVRRPDLGPASKAEAATLFRGLFEPGNIVSLALASTDDRAPVPPQEPGAAPA